MSLMQENKQLFHKEIESDQPRLQITSDWPWRPKIYEDFPFRNLML